MVFGARKAPCLACDKPFRPVSEFHQFCCYSCRMAAYRYSMLRDLG
jgi:hypothetical protein